MANLDRETIRLAKLLAAKRRTSINSMIGAQIEGIVGADEAYEMAKRQPIALIDRGFPVGGKPSS